MAELFVPPVPAPPAAPLPLLAFLRAIRTNALTIWPERAYQEEHIVRYMLGRPNILLNGADAIQHVLVDNHMNYKRSPASIRILRPLTGDGLLLSQGEAWRLQRRTIAPALAPRVLPILSRHIVTATQEALARWTPELDLLAAVQHLALEIASRSMFSIDIGAGEMTRYGAAMRRLLGEYNTRYAQAHLLDMLLPPSVTTPRDLARRRFQRRWMPLIEAMMADRMRVPEPETPRDLFDLLRAARDPETGAGFPAAHLRDQVATMILAGHETTAVTLFWALTLLAQAPAEQDAVASEVQGVALDPASAFAAIGRLARTRAVVNETLRLFPPAFTLVREAIAADIAGGVPVPKGAVVMIAPWVLHRHRLRWHRPEAFDPSRFLPGNAPPSRTTFMPFGAGPRICVGAQFAMAEAVLVLAAVLQRFTVSLVGERPVLPVALVTTQPDHPPLFRLTPRSL